MAYKVTTRRSYGSRILNSFVGVLVGIALIIGMSVLLFWNEGRYNLANMAKDAQEITAANASTLDGQLVWYKGTLSGQPMTFDGVITDDSYMYLKSEVEVYAWIETSRQETRDNFGGSQTTETIYEYNLGWTTNPQNPANFTDPDKKSLPLATAAVAPVEFKNNGISTADFAVNADLSIDGIRVLNLVSGDTVNASALNADVIINGGYVYYKVAGSTGPTTPILGDTRAKYSYIPSTLNGVLVGKADSANTAIIKFSNDKGSLYRFFEASDIDQVVGILNAEHKQTTWMLRLIGTLFMCIGFAMLTGPFSTLLMVVPMLGKASKFLLGIVSFLIGLVYSIIVIILSAIIHNPIALVIAIGIVVAIVYMGYKKRKENKTPVPAKATKKR